MSLVNFLGGAMTFELKETKPVVEEGDDFLPYRTYTFTDKDPDIKTLTVTPQLDGTFDVSIAHKPKATEDIKVLTEDLDIPLEHRSPSSTSAFLAANGLSQDQLSALITALATDKEKGRDTIYWKLEPKNAEGVIAKEKELGSGKKSQGINEEGPRTGWAKGIADKK